MSKIVVIIPCYNAKDTLLDTLLSLKLQTFKDFDIILSVDGKNTDNYTNIVTEANLNNISIYEWKDNKGPGLTRQRALDSVYTNYKYVTFLDADDCFYPQTLEILYTTAENNRADIVASNIDRLTSDGTIIPITTSNVNDLNITWTHGKLYNIEFLKKYDIRFSNELFMNEDVHFNNLAFYFSKTTIGIDTSLYIWKYNKSSITSQYKSKKYQKLNTLCSIKASVLSILDAAKRDNNSLKEDFLISRIVAIYNMYNEGLHNNVNMKACKKYFDKLNKEIDLKEFVNNNLNILEFKLKQIGNYYNTYYYFKLSFEDFINTIT